LTHVQRSIRIGGEGPIASFIGLKALYWDI